MDALLKDFIEISNALGSDPRLVQGGGGNTSVKDQHSRRMFVKASGVALKDVNQMQGGRLVDVDKCNSIIDDDAIAELTSVERENFIASRLEQYCIDDRKGRPSVETNLHAILGRCVAHTHPAALNAILCCDKADAILNEIYKDDSFAPFVVLDYVDFGYPLALKMRDSITSFKDKYGQLPHLIFLKNHGVFVSGESPEFVVEMTRKVVEKAGEFLKEKMQAGDKRDIPEVGESKEQSIQVVMAALRRFYTERLGTPVLVNFTDDTHELNSFLHVPETKMLTEFGALVPDQQLYCNGAPVWVDYNSNLSELTASVESALSREEDSVNTPVCLIIDGLGLFTASSTKKLLYSARDTMMAALYILAGAYYCGLPKALPADAIQGIKDSEWEKYRHKMYENQTMGSDLSGKVAVVTGAGSGLGRGISMGLANEGMHVVLADIDADGAQETVDRIAAIPNSDTCALPFEVDVTDEKAVNRLYQNVVRELGGVDVLVNCASIAPPASLLDFPADAFRKSLDINLTGYLLMAQGAARVMKRQGTGGSIINLSSKSGLEASKNHSAYNATKAGEIHLARGWALELAQYKIRVNSVCPGNVFHESKIWNDEYIEALGKKRGLETEQVIPYYINMTALQEEIHWEDIANAVAFLSSTKSAKITGQTLVVDAGQVFVR